MTFTPEVVLSKRIPSHLEFAAVLRQARREDLSDQIDSNSPLSHERLMVQEQVIGLGHINSTIENEAYRIAVGPLNLLVLQTVEVCGGDDASVFVMQAVIPFPANSDDQHLAALARAVWLLESGTERERAEGTAVLAEFGISEPPIGDFEI